MLLCLHQMVIPLMNQSQNTSTSDRRRSQIGRRSIVGRWCICLLIRCHICDCPVQYDTVLQHITSVPVDGCRCSYCGRKVIFIVAPLFCTALYIIIRGTPGHYAIMVSNVLCTCHSLTELTRIFTIRVSFNI